MIKVVSSLLFSSLLFSSLLFSSLLFSSLLFSSLPTVLVCLLLGVDLGLRINCEMPRSLHPLGVNTNLQTFLIIPNGLTTAAASVSPTAASVTHQAIATAHSTQVSLASVLNIPGFMGSELDYQSYARSVRALTGGGQ